MDETHNDGGVVQTKKNNLIQTIKSTVTSFSITEKIIFLAILVIFILSALGILSVLNKSQTVSMPVHGGTYTEGVVGYARFINPVLSYTDADKDLGSLIYSGLLKVSPNGELTNDLAESYSISEDGLVYDFKLKDGLTFHDGKPLTTDDVEFTIQKITDSAIKSPRFLNWNGVQIQKINETEIKFILKKSYTPFIENMTIGILPKHIWESVQNEAFDISAFNREPIGSGPYKIKSATRDSTGLYESYNLESFIKYANGEPYIKNLIVNFYKNEKDAVEAFNYGYIDGLGGISPETAKTAKIGKNENGKHAIKSTLPRIFAVFFNQSQSPVLLNKEVRNALNTAINREDLIAEIFNGFATPAYGPIPYEKDSKNKPPQENNEELAKRILSSGGWKPGEDGIMVKNSKSGKGSSTQRLSFTLTTSNIPELRSTAESLKARWQKIGAEVDIQLFDSTDLNQTIIRPRKYSALLFGNIINRDLDLYPFWHSSQRTDPGLNIAQYANIKVDKLIDISRSSMDDEKRVEAYRQIEKEIQEDVPAIFLYSPDYIYLTSGRAKNIKIENPNQPSERFSNINEWYTKTENIWKFLINKQDNK